MVNNWLSKNFFFFFFIQYSVSKSTTSMQVIELVGFNAWFISTISWLTSRSWHPCTVWFIHSSFKKIGAFNELRWVNGRYVRQLSRLPTSWSWHSTKCHLSEGALKSDRPLWLSCSGGQGSSSQGSDPQRAFSLSGAECKSKTSNSILSKFRLYPHPLRFRDRTVSEKIDTHYHVRFCYQGKDIP